MKPTDKMYKAALNAFYTTRAEAEHEPNIVCMRRAVDAAFDAQCKTERKRKSLWYNYYVARVNWFGNHYESRKEADEAAQDTIFRSHVMEIQFENGKPVNAVFHKVAE